MVDHLVRRSIWIVGGDGWAYDIGYGGLDHVLATGPRRQYAGARYRGLFQHRRPGLEGDAAWRGRKVRRRRQAGRAQGPGACRRSPMETSTLRRSRWAPTSQQTLQAFREAEAYDGPSLILAYSHCIAHGIDMRFGMKQQDLAVASGYWPLFRFNPTMRTSARTRSSLDSPRPTIPLQGLCL